MQFLITLVAILSVVCVLYKLMHIIIAVPGYAFTVWNLTNSELRNEYYSEYLDIYVPVYSHILLLYTWNTPVTLSILHQ